MEILISRMNVINIISAVILISIIVFVIYSDYKKNNTDNTREIKVISKQFSFEPNPIKVKLNERVRIRLTTTDVAHGMAVPEFGFVLNVDPGQEAVGELQPNRKGTFIVRCSISCGSGHSDMKAKLIVE